MRLPEIILFYAVFYFRSRWKKKHCCVFSWGGLRTPEPFWNRNFRNELTIYKEYPNRVQIFKPKTTRVVGSKKVKRNHLTTSCKLKNLKNRNFGKLHAEITLPVRLPCKVIFVENTFAIWVFSTTIASIRILGIPQTFSHFVPQRHGFIR